MRSTSLLFVFAVVATTFGCAAPDDPTAGDDEATPDDEEPSTPDPADDPVDPPPTTSSIALVPGCTATAMLAGHPTWFFFTRPDHPCEGTAGSGIDRHAVAELARVIRSVPAGGRIDGHIFSISVDDVAKALLDAQTKGVDVHLSTDGGVATSMDTAKTNYLDKLTHKVYCTSTTNSACIATADKAISHTKLFTFSTATTPDGTVHDNVVWFGSANQTYASGMRLYNNTVTVYGDATLYTKLTAYLGDLYARRRTSDYYDPTSGRGHLLTDAADVYVSPEAETDLVVHRLDDITADSSCRIRVMQASVRDSRIEVVDELVSLKRSGCHVWVAADTVEPHALAKLHAASIPVHQMPIHDKSFIVYAKFGSAYEYRIFTGSHNLSSGSAHRFDEIFVKLAAETGAAHPIYDAYYTHFNDAYNQGAAL